MRPNRREFLQTVAAVGTQPLVRVSKAASAAFPARTESRPLTVFPSLEVTSVTDESQRIVIETTGARFLIERTNPARIQLIQKINGPRDLCQIELDTSFADLTLDYHDRDQCVLYVPVADCGFNICIHGDSLLDLRAGSRVRCHMRGQWLPDYSYAEAGNLLFLDRRGGYGQYALTSPQLYSGDIVARHPGVSFSPSGWETYLELPVRQKLLACVAPPREFDFDSSVNDRIVHHWIAGKRADGTWNYFASDSQIKDYARWGNVLALHMWARGAGPFRGNQVGNAEQMYAKAAPWASRYSVPLDEGEFRRVIRTAQSSGMRVLPYLSPQTFPGTPREFHDELERLMDVYAVDGFYFDGVSEDVLTGYEIMKGARGVVGRERLLYVHVPSPILGSSYMQGRYVYCPFIDNYANFILRAEHIDTFDDQTLRYTISAYNISNTIGYVCNYDYNLEFNRELIRRVLDYHARVPYWVGFDIYLKDIAPRTHKDYAPESALHEIMRQDYFPALDRLKR